MKISAFFICAIALLTGCLKTRADLREDRQDQTPQIETVSHQVQVAQQQTAANTAAPAPVRPAPPPSPASRFEEVDEQMRQLNGRMDVIDNSITQAGNTHQAQLAQEAKDKAQIDQKFVAYDEALKKLEAQVVALNEEVAALKAPPTPAAVATPAKETPAKGRSAYDEGDALFNAKKYREAAFAFQKYRSANAKGKMYGDATYKMGVCFQELGLKDEARVFYQELVTKFPGSKEAKKASVRMKTLK